MTDLPGFILLGLRFGLAICLFLFLFWAIRLLWKDLKSLPALDQTAKPVLLLKIFADQEDPGYLGCRPGAGYGRQHAG